MAKEYINSNLENFNVPSAGNVGQVGERSAVKNDNNKNNDTVMEYESKVNWNQNKYNSVKTKNSNKYDNAKNKYDNPEQLTSNLNLDGFQNNIEAIQKKSENLINEINN